MEWRNKLVQEMNWDFSIFLRILTLFQADTVSIPFQACTEEYFVHFCLILLCVCVCVCVYLDKL